MSVIQADARRLPFVDACVQCVVTSPPYYGLRDYGVVNQIGAEVTPTLYVEALVSVFREIRRVLTRDGVCWLNLGDRYGPRGLLGVPWRVALALQGDGWHLRSDVIWSKPNGMPESVTNRPTSAHEYVFLLAKSNRYFYDAAAITEPHAELARPQSERRRQQRMSRAVAAVAGGGQSSKGIDDGRVVPTHMMQTNAAGRNRRSVWTIATQPYHGAHCAPMPERLVEPCILAGSRFGDLVCDPFLGSGTVGMVAARLGRRWVGTELNPAYHDLVRVRTAQRGLRFDD